VIQRDIKDIVGILMRVLNRGEVRSLAIWPWP